MRRPAGFAAPLLVVACAPLSGPPPRALPVFANAPECAEVVARAAADSTLQRRAPVPLTVILPPLDDVPYAIRGKTASVTFSVNEAGRVTGVAISGLDHPSYEARMIQRIMRNRFQPAEIDGCWVPGRTLVLIRLPK